MTKSGNHFNKTCTAMLSTLPRVCTAAPLDIPQGVFLQLSRPPFQPSEWCKSFKKRGEGEGAQRLREREEIYAYMSTGRKKERMKEVHIMRTYVPY